MKSVSFPICLRAMVISCLLCLTLHSCTESNRTNSDSEQVYCHTCPMIRPQEDSLEFASRAMRFVSKNADTGLLPNQLCDSSQNIGVMELPIDQMLRVFDENEGVASCNLAASILADILIQNGISAYTYSFGFPETDLSHMVTLVKVKRELYLFDPFLNYFLADESGSPLPLHNFFDLVLDAQPAFQYHSEPVLGDMTVDFSLVDTALLIQNESIRCKDWSKGFVRLKGTIHQIRISRSFKDALNRPCNSFIKRMEAHLLTSTGLHTFAQAMLLKTGAIKGADDHEKVDSELNALIARQNWNYLRLGSRFIYRE